MTDRVNILLVEDDASLARWIADYLIQHGMSVSVATRGDVALELIREDVPDAVILDIGLPVIDGLSVCRRARAFYRGPILILTARDDDEDEVNGLDVGADDYLCKPIRPRILLARLRAQLRREHPAATQDVLRMGNLLVDSALRKASIGSTELELSTQEFDVLLLLTESAGRPVDRQTLSTQLRGIDYDGFDRSVDIAVSRLRRKLANVPDHSHEIKTVRGRGYQLALTST